MGAAGPSKEKACYVHNMTSRPLPPPPVAPKALHKEKSSDSPPCVIPVNVAPDQTSQISCLEWEVPVSTNSKTVTTSKSMYGGIERMYTIPPFNQAESTDKGTVAGTISAIKKRFLQTQQPFLRPCPIGLTDSEKEKFCIYMEFSHSSLREGGWKDLTERLLLLNDKDFTLIENFCYQSNIPVMEVVFEHWNLMYIQSSSTTQSKCLLEPCKHSLVMALQEMGRIDILSNMEWSNM